MKIHYIFIISSLFSSFSFSGEQNSLQCSLIESLINSDKLNKYFHVDVLPNRSPLNINTSNLTINNNSSCNKIEKFGKPVVITEKTNALNPLIIREIKIKENHATIEYAYPPEGIRGNVEFTYNKNTWMETKHFIVEN